jgi:hypothetical protein
MARATKKTKAKPRTSEPEMSDIMLHANGLLAIARAVNRLAAAAEILSSPPQPQPQPEPQPVVTESEQTDESAVQ